ncbi:MAG: bifunctional riboflavin kinase/FAD synthetase [Candidatus Omnitrophota bacterium]
MKVLYGYRDLAGKLKSPIVAIGMFDGLHIGHKRVLNKVLSSRMPESDKVVITFDPHPQMVLSPKKVPLRIMSLEHRLYIFQKMGFSSVVILRFTEFMAKMSAEDFIKKILRGMGTKRVYVGENFYFGKNKSGDISTFRSVGKKYGIEVITVPQVKMKRRIVSSTWLRRLITFGKLKKAELLLRRPVSVLGKVVKGDKRGSVLGVPTANIDPHQEVIPPPGVYAVKVDINGSLCDGVLNVGFKPTFYGRKLRKRKEPSSEVHLIDFNGDLYGSVLEIFFIKRLRKEKKFKKQDNLVFQIKKDIKEAQVFLTSKKMLSRIERYKSL